jgi:hypothetical protein
MLFFCVLFPYSLWRLNGHDTILIDRDAVRHDWWCFWGRRSRIYPRPETIKTEINPGGSTLVGGAFGANIRIGKGWRRKLEMYLPLAAERQYLFAELARFQEEIPATQLVDEKRPVQKGSFTDSESGLNVLQTLDWHGKSFQRVVPQNESAVKEQPQPGIPGVLSLRCAKCHKIVPRDHVLPDKPLAKCPDCGFVFEPQELLRETAAEEESNQIDSLRPLRDIRALCGKINRKERNVNAKCAEEYDIKRRSRLRIYRDADSLEIVQRPLRTGLPLCTILLFLLVDLGIVAIYFYMKQLMPDVDPFLSLQNESGEPMLGWFIIATIVFQTLLLPIPLWSFFDRRTIRLNRETLEIKGRWLLFAWKRTVPRWQVKKASFIESHALLYNLKLGYGNRSAWIGCSSRKEAEMLRSEINHFLYTIHESRERNNVERPDAPGVPAKYPVTSLRCVPGFHVHDVGTFLGGTESFDPEVALHCPDCGAKLPSSSLDFPGGNAHCDTCRKDFPIENAVAYKIEVIPHQQPECITVERTDDSMTMQYVPNYDKGYKYFYFGIHYFGVLMFIGMIALSVFLLVREPAVIMFVLLGLSVLVYVPLLYACMQETKSIYCDWTIHLDANEVQIELRCKKRCKMVVIPREKIIEARRNEGMRGFPKFRIGSLPEFLWSREQFGSHFLMNDGTKHYLPLGTVDQRKVQETTNWMLAELNGFLAGHPRDTNQRKNVLESTH